MSNEKIRITDHAKIRYLERVRMMDIEKVEDEILDKRIVKNILTLGDGEYPLSNGTNIAVVKNNVIITIK